MPRATETREARRLRRASAREEKKRVKRCELVEDDDDVHTVEDVEETPEGLRNWFCCLCPIHLSSSEEMRVIVPCGHTLCLECAEQLTGRSHCAKCSKKSDGMIKPNIQLADIDQMATPLKSTNGDEEAEIQQIQEEIRQIDAKLQEVQKASVRSNEEFLAREKLLKQNVEVQRARQAKEQLGLREAKIKLQLAEYLKHLDASTDPTLDPSFRLCHVQKLTNAGVMTEMAKNGYKMASDALTNFLQLENMRLRHDAAKLKRKVSEGKEDRRIFKKAVDELLENMKQTNGVPGIISHFQELEEQLSKSLPGIFST